MSMFGKKENSSPANPKAMNQLGQGTVINGEINSDADIRIDGTVKGNVISKGKIVLGATGQIEGDIRSENAYVEGRVNGKVEVADLLILSKTAFVNGDIMIKKLVVEEGAKFNGKCTMGVQINRQQTTDTATPKNDINKPDLTDKTDITAKIIPPTANVVRPIVKAV
jgi:cytoskeletal protein CcmA (bactofilin family)